MTTYTARWKPVTYTVRFSPTNGSTVYSKSVNEGSVVTEPVPPTRDGYVFDGWYLDDKLWDFDKDRVTKSITLTAKWLVATHTEVTVTDSAKYGDTITIEVEVTAYDKTIPTGNVDITVDKTVHKGVELTEGHCKLDVNLDVGSYVITAACSGDEKYAYSKSDEMNCNVLEGENSLTIYDGIRKITAGKLTKQYGDEDFILMAEGSSNGAVSWSIEGLDVATIDKNGYVSIKGAGVAEITARKEPDGKYTEAIAVITLEVSEDWLFIDAKDKTVVYGEKIENLEYEVYNLREHQDDIITDNPVFITTNATCGSDAGEYDIEVSGGETKNYKVVPLNGVLTIEQAQATVSLIANGGAIYGEQVQLTAEVKGVESGNTPTGTVSFTVDGDLTYGPYELVDGTCTTAITLEGGEHSLEAVYNGNKNYLSAKSQLDRYTVEKVNQSPLQIVSGNNIVSSELSAVYGDSLSLGVIGGSGSGDITWSSSNESIATVDTNGNVTILAAGSVAITATKVADDDYNVASVSATLNISKIQQENLYIIGENINSGAIEVKSDSGSFILGTEGGSGSGDITWLSSDESIATVDESGKVTIAGSGTAIITATKQGDTIYENSTASVSLKISSQIQYAYISGYSEDNTFRPDNPLTRAEAAQLLYNIYVIENGKPELVAGKSFSDVTNQNWYYEAVMYLTQSGVISGYPDGSFKPEAQITRAELTKLAVMFAGLSESESTSNFPDVSSGHWATYYINTAQNSGILIGYDDGTFKPENDIKRAESVTILNRMQGRIVSETILEGLTMPYSDVAKTHWAYYEILEAAVVHEAC